MPRGVGVGPDNSRLHGANAGCDLLTPMVSSRCRDESFRVASNNGTAHAPARPSLRYCVAGLQCGLLEATSAARPVELLPQRRIRSTVRRRCEASGSETH